MPDLDCITPLKRCWKCHNSYPATREFFYAHSGRKDGLQSICKGCAKEQARQYHIEYPDKTKEQHRRSYTAHRDEVNTHRREVYTKNTAKESARNHRYYRAHCEEAKKRKRQYHHAHPEIAKVSRHKRHARRLALPSTFTNSDWEFALTYFHGVCAYCGSGPGLFDRNWALHQDHFIPLSRGGGYSVDNILPACQECNLLKHNQEPEKWLIRRYGTRKANKILNTIKIFFASVQSNYRSEPAGIDTPHSALAGDRSEV